MTRQQAQGHSLHPFEPAAGPVRSVNAWASAFCPSGQPPQLRLRYCVQPLAGLRLPQPGLAPTRRDGLWQHTCLEAFVGVAEREEYWEFNLAPGGDWAVYRLASYRQGLQSEAWYDALPFGVTVSAASASEVTSEPPSPARLTLELSCSLPPELAGATRLQLGLTAVLESDDGSLSYWALTHPGPEADFHDRRSWIVDLAVEPVR